LVGSAAPGTAPQLRSGPKLRVCSRAPTKRLVGCAEAGAAPQLRSGPKLRACSRAPTEKIFGGGFGRRRTACYGTSGRPRQRRVHGAMLPRRLLAVLLSADSKPHFHRDDDRKSGRGMQGPACCEILVDVSEEEVSQQRRCGTRQAKGLTSREVRYMCWSRCAVSPR
jgi:hypothetical protein